MSQRHVHTSLYVKYAKHATKRKPEVDLQKSIRPSHSCVPLVASVILRDAERKGGEYHADGAPAIANTLPSFTLAQYTEPLAWTVFPVMNVSCVEYNLLDAKVGVFFCTFQIILLFSLSIAKLFVLLLRAYPSRGVVHTFLFAQFDCRKMRFLNGYVRAI